LEEVIKNLVALQEVDLEIKKIDEELATVSAELDSMRASVEEHKAAIAEAEERLAAGEARRKELEAAVEEAQGMVKDRQNKLMSVQTNREYQSLLKEIDDAKVANKERDDEVVQILEEAEYVQAKLDERRVTCAKEEEELAAAEKEAIDREKTLTRNRTKVNKKRKTASGKLDERQLRRYEQIREHREGVAVVGVRDGVCFGCYMNVPPQLYNNLLKSEALLSCPTCNRMIYYLPEPEKVEG